MFDFDAIIIGSGPAGITAGIYLARAKYRTIVLDKESFGGYPKNIDLIENYPGFPDGISGAQLASSMVAQAKKHGVRFDNVEVSGLEFFSDCRWVNCTNGQGYTTAVVIIAGGSRHKMLGIRGETEFQGKGVFECALCDGGQFEGGVVAVCGGGDSAISEALYMSRIASKVIVIHRRNQLRAAKMLQDRALAEPKIEFIWDSAVEAIEGQDRVKHIKIRNLLNNTNTDLSADGLLVQIGTEPVTDYLNGMVPLDKEGFVIVNSQMETDVPHVLAAGDIRSGSPRQIAAAVGDGAIAGITAQRLLQKLG
jgi:thioredoxin reductase (NADPH)